MIKRLAMGVAIFIACTIAASPAFAKHHHKKHYQVSYSGEGVIGGRPSGCPYRYCGCSASLYLFGKIIPELNLASNWIKKFPRTYPAPRMAAARSGHVMVLVSHVEGDLWMVHDGNSGGHLTREHVRSISGYIIVDPNGNGIGHAHSKRFERIARLQSKDRNISLEGQ